ncbi:MAG: homoserine kinase, partial [Parafannyhessea umbonata]|nr:homoserine kinase [Parafannyhessea umbonata]
LSAAAKDRLHEPYRATLIPDYEPIRRTALAAGAAAFLISGSGSTMLAITDGRDAAERVATSVTNMVENHVDGLWVRVLAANSRGTWVEVL